MGIPVDREKAYRKMLVEKAATVKLNWLSQYDRIISPQRFGYDQPPDEMRLSDLLLIHDKYVERMQTKKFEPFGQTEGDDTVKKEVDQIVEDWTKLHGIWLGRANVGKPFESEISAEVNEMNTYLGPFSVSKERSILTGKIYMILFYIDDTVANEYQKKMTPEQQHDFKNFMMGYLWSIENNAPNPFPAPKEPVDCSGLNSAMQSVMEDLMNPNSGFFPSEEVRTEWMGRFKNLLNSHLIHAVKDYNSVTTDKVLTEEEYTVNRNEVSGMRVSNLLIEFLKNEYIDWGSLEAKNKPLFDKLEKMKFDTAVLAGFFNDLFSVEKESLDELGEKDEFNIIPILMLNDPNLTLVMAIHEAAQVINEYIIDFYKLKVDVLSELDDPANPERNSVLSQKLRGYIDALEDEVMAAWVWQLYTKRYLRLFSVFAENRWKNHELRTGLLQGKPVTQIRV